MSLEAEAAELQAQFGGDPSAVGVRSSRAYQDLLHVAAALLDVDVLDRPTWLRFQAAASWSRATTMLEWLNELERAR